MKAEGKDIEYKHSADDFITTMTHVGFTEVGIIWRMFADTILIGFVSG
jgi:hypothetical protein